MQKLLKTNLFLGSKLDFENLFDKQEWAIVHACKSYFDKLQHSIITGNRVVKLNNDLYINWQDLEGVEGFEVSDFINAMNFIDDHIKVRRVLVHCDWGQSRSATLAMVYLSKRLQLLPDNFFDAVAEFKVIYPNYHLPSGISKFVNKYWSQIN